MNTKTLLLTLPLLAVCHPLAAEEVRMLNDTPSVEELRGYLAPESPRRTRSIEIVGSIARQPPASMAAYAKAAATTPAQNLQASPPATKTATAVQPEPAEEAGVVADGQEVQVPAEQPVTIGYRIQFAFDSAEIEDTSEPFLDQLGQLLNEEPEVALVVEGHTDARGSDAYNRVLSQRRAEAVSAYLMQAWNVSPERLVIDGKGETEPLAANGEAPENRRVQFRRVGA